MIQHLDNECVYEDVVGRRVVKYLYCTNKLGREEWFLHGRLEVFCLELELCASDCDFDYSYKQSIDRLLTI